MGQDSPRVLITTSSNPAEQSRIFTKVLKHVLPNASILNRGNYNLNDLHLKSMQMQCDYVYMVYSKQNRVDKLIVFKIYADKLVQEGLILKINQYIDHKIYGFHSLPEHGPLSTSLETRALNTELIDYFEKYWFVELGKKNALWLALDQAEHKKTSYITFIDAMTQKKFFYAELQLISGDYY